MDEFELRRIIYDYIREICHYSQMQVFSTSSYQNKYFQMQIEEAVDGLINLYTAINNDALGLQIQPSSKEPPVHQLKKLKNKPLIMSQIQKPTQSEDRVISVQELAQNDGSEGKPAFVAVNNEVYDMTNVLQWAGGTHFGLFAGQNLSQEFLTCHSGMEDILTGLQKVGVLQENV
jgi:Predicted heme/steroid binding protein